jgi:rSAM/selenodomain-associated transferase 1
MTAALVMAKAPVAGRVKTRLTPAFTAAQCAQLQELLVRRAAAWAADVAPAAAYLAYDPPERRALVQALAPAAMTLLPQSRGHLGERLDAATAHVFARRRGPLLVVGVDTRLTRAHARDALAAIGDGADAVFGPALDGGYYLVALRNPAPELFAIDPGAWGGPDVLERSLEAAQAAGLTATTIGSERDLDTPADAAALTADPELGQFLRSVLAGAPANA